MVPAPVWVNVPKLTNAVSRNGPVGPSQHPVVMKPSADTVISPEFSSSVGWADCSIPMLPPTHASRPSFRNVRPMSETLPSASIVPSASGARTVSPPPRCVPPLHTNEPSMTSEPGPVMIPDD